MKNHIFAVRRPVLFLFVVLTVLNLAPHTGSCSTYSVYLDYSETWYDADKTVANTDDDLMCWAASASNVLAYTGWGDIYSTSEDEIFSYFQAHWSDAGGYMQYGWEWWFNGRTPPPSTNGASQVEEPGGGFFQDTFFMEYFSWTRDTGSIMSWIDTSLNTGAGVSLAIYGLDSSDEVKGAHALTIWGYDFDELSGIYSGIWVTDSDDGEDALQYYGLSFDDGVYWILNYGSLYDWYITAAYALDQIPEAIAASLSVPIPSSAGILGMALLCLFAMKRKQF